MAETVLKLPVLAVGPSEVGRLERELESLDDYLRQANLRSHGQPIAGLPKTSRMLGAFIEENGLNLLLPAERARAVAFMRKIQDDAPVVTMSFAVDPSAAFVGKLVGWLRQNVHPELLLRVGLQPNIAAGCTLRTASRSYDFSLRAHFAQQRGLLVRTLREAAALEPKP